MEAVYSSSLLTMRSANTRARLPYPPIPSSDSISPVASTASCLCLAHYMVMDELAKMTIINFLSILFWKTVGLSKLIYECEVI